MKTVTAILMFLNFFFAAANLLFFLVGDWVNGAVGIFNVVAGAGLFSTYSEM